MQITQERWEYDLMTNTVNSMQQTISLLSEGDSSVCNTTKVIEPELHYTYLINSQKKLKQVLKTSISNTNRSSQTFTAFTGVSFINDCLLQPMLYVSHPLLQFADITDPLLSTAALFSRFYIVTVFRPELLRRPHVLQDEF